MQTKQTIAIIGATGNTGSAIARSLSTGNFRLLLKATGQEELDSLVESIKNNHPDADVEAAACATEASWEADIIILASPHEAEEELVEKIRDVANQKIVITVGDHDSNEALQQLLPNSKVKRADWSTALIGGQEAEAFIAELNDQY